MSEKLLVVEDKKLSHKGTFFIDSVLSHIRKNLEGKGYKLVDESHDIVADEKGKIHTITQPFVKPDGPYANSEVLVTIKATMVPVIIERKSGSVKGQQGAISITFRGTVLSQFERRYGENPGRYFWTWIMGKFFSSNALPKTGVTLKDDILDLYLELDTMFKNE